MMWAAKPLEGAGKACEQEEGSGESASLLLVLFCSVRPQIKPRPTPIHWKMIRLSRS